jgi:hypothetical protein
MDKREWLKANFMGIIRKIYKRSFFKIIIDFFMFIYIFYKRRIMPDKWFIKKEYKRIFGEYPNLDLPSTLNEKIQWLKLYDRSSLHTKCADKYESRNYINQKIGKDYLVPLLYHTRDVNEITADRMPDYPVAVKTNHDSGVVEIIRDKNNYDFSKLREILKKSLNKNYYYISRERQYKDIIPRVIIEKLLVCEDGKLPNDYKIHCFNGEPKIIYVSIDREGINKRNIYSSSWEPLMFTWASKYKSLNNIRGKEIPRPKNYEKMLDIAKILAADFKYVRIDLFNLNGTIKCGEITFYHGGGLFPILPRKWDFKLGSYLKI